jgi:hypothetical protein
MRDWTDGRGPDLFFLVNSTEGGVFTLTFQRCSIVTIVDISQIRFQPRQLQSSVFALCAAWCLVAKRNNTRFGFWVPHEGVSATR